MNGLRVFILAFGTLFCVIAVALGVIQKRKTSRCSERTIGTVIGYKSMTSGGAIDDVTTQMWHPIIEYYANGRRITKTSAVGNAKKQYDEGERLELFFDPDEPERFYLDGERAYRLLSVIFGAVGILMSAGGALLFLLG